MPRGFHRFPSMSTGAAIRIQIDAVVEKIRGEVQSEANRKRSEAAKEQPRPTGGKFGAGGGSHEPRPASAKESKVAQALASKAKVSTSTAKRALELKTKAPERFAQVASGKAELNKELREVKREEKHASIAEQSRSSRPLGEVQSCPIIYADPPWQYGNTAGASAAEDEYPTMPLADICALVPPATKDAVLFLWATSPLLPEAMQVITAWGFTYKGSMVWDKDMGTGNWVLNCHELLLIAVRGDIPCPAPSNRPKSVVRAKRGAHSAKPEEFAQLIERMFPTLPKVEMFARKTRDGWTVWGNQAA
jgi:N6-adenosine-specific RNA methylase IME4